MKKYLSVSIGPSPDHSTEIFFSDDPGLIALVVECLMERLANAPAPEPMLAN